MATKKSNKVKQYLESAYFFGLENSLSFYRLFKKYKAGTRSDELNRNPNLKIVTVPPVRKPPETNREVLMEGLNKRLGLGEHNRTSEMRFVRKPKPPSPQNRFYYLILIGIAILVIFSEGRVAAERDWDNNFVCQAATSPRSILNLLELAYYGKNGYEHMRIADCEKCNFLRERGGNNQVAFVTDPSCTDDVAKALDVPIFLLNRDDLESVVHVWELASEWRQTFHSDVVSEADLFTGVWSMAGFLLDNRPVQTLRNIRNRLEQDYCGKFGYEYMHIADNERCIWLRERGGSFAGQGGQGVVYETFSLCALSALDVPIFHVNGDDLEAVVHVQNEELFTVSNSSLSDFGVLGFELGYSMENPNSLVIWEAQFGDYSNRAPVIFDPFLSSGEANWLRQTCLVVLLPHGYDGQGREHSSARLERFLQDHMTSKRDWLSAYWLGFKSPEQLSRIRNTGVKPEILTSVGKAITTIPEDFKPHKAVKRIYDNRAQMIETGEGIDWAVGEALAFATLLVEGNHVRLSGQDAERGTFSHRHSVIHDQEPEGQYCPLDHVVKDQNEELFTVSNSSSEFGVLGFELGYSMENPNSLVIWEAQFGDYSNTAPVIFDQFLSSGEANWLRQTRLVMLLPHGYDGQGPEHSSARLERFLQIPTTIKELEAAIQDHLAQASSICLLNKNYLIEHEATQEKIEQLPKTVTEKDHELTTCLTEIDSLKASWLPALHNLVCQINETFSRNFQQRAVAGEISPVAGEHDMDFVAFGVVIKVKFRQTGQLQVLSSDHHQSGGEHSVSTILCLVSLQDLTTCPFGVVDETNQGMDPVNERTMFQQLVAAASQPNTPQCFLLTPELLPDLEYIMNGPVTEGPAKLCSNGGSVIRRLGQTQC